MDAYSVKFVAKKINKIRWRPKLDPKGLPSKTFATGSWNDQTNCVAIWNIQERPAAENEDSDAFLVQEPQKLFETDHVGDVMDLQYVNHDLLAAASSTGSVSLLKHRPNNETLTTVYNWDKLHKFKNGDPAACTCLATRGDNWIASGGEDGQTVVVAVEQGMPLQTLDKVDSCAVNDLTFRRQTEIITVNSFGQLKTFDLRQDTIKESQIFTVTESHTPLLCVDRHPGQPHIVATGDDNGMLTIWDLRQEKFHMTLMEAHTGPIWEVKFHPQYPNHLFTCSNDGSLWHWDSTACITETVQPFTPGKGKLSASTTTNSISSPWLSLVETASSNKLDIASLLPNKSLPVNSLDIQAATLLCGTDSETIYTIPMPALS